MVRCEIFHFGLEVIEEAHYCSFGEMMGGMLR